MDRGRCGVEAGKRLMERLDNLAIPDRAEEIRCFFVGRNEAPRLPEFLEYHRRLGVDRFFFVDNGSIDESVEIALAEAKRNKRSLIVADILEEMEKVREGAERAG